jgi:hypothetical protein
VESLFMELCKESRKMEKGKEWILNYYQKLIWNTLQKMTNWNLHSVR